MKFTLIFLISLLAVWTAYSWIPLRNIESPNYTVLEKRNGYEIRKYDSYITASTYVQGDYGSGLNDGFRIVANYIFGGNQDGIKIAMTTPVTEEPAFEKGLILENENTTNKKDERIVSFVMPSEFSLETLPNPNSDRVTLKEIPSRIVAVRRFGWYATQSRVKKNKEKLLHLLEQDDLEVTGPTQSAYYNQPISIPLLLRNEIIVPIEYGE